MTLSLCFLQTVFPSILLLSLIYNKFPYITAFRIIMDQNSNNSFAYVPDHLQNSDQDTSLEDTFLSYIVSNRFCDDRCKEIYEMTEYPYKKIMDVIDTNKKDVIQIRPVGRTHLIPRCHISSSIVPSPVDTYGFAKSAASACKKIYQRLYPIKGKGINGKLYYIINVKGFQQITIITMCHKSGQSCGNKGTVSENYTYQCKQKYEDVELSAFPVGQNITVNTQITQTFKIPTDCSCEQVRT